MSTNTKRKTEKATRKGGAKPQSTRAKQASKPARTPRSDTKQALVLKMLASTPARPRATRGF